MKATCLSLLRSSSSTLLKNTTILVNVGVVLDMDNWIGKIGLSCISMALSDFCASHENYKTRLVLHTRDSKNDIIGAAAAGTKFASDFRDKDLAALCYRLPWAQ